MSAAGAPVRRVSIEVAPTGATADFYRRKGLKYPPEHGPLAAVTPGTPGALLTILDGEARLIVGARALAAAEGGRLADAVRRAAPRGRRTVRRARGRWPRAR